MSDKADIKELAIAAWRLEKWLENLNVERKMAAKSALRSIKKYISASGIDVKDPLGSKFDPGLAVEVVCNEAENSPEENLIIIETLSPYVYQNGELVRHARVIIGTVIKEAKKNSGTVEKLVYCNNTDEADETELKSSSKIISERSPQEVFQTTTKADDVQINEDEIERIMAYAKIF